MNKLLRNKKAIDYAAMLVVIVIICSVMLYVKMTDKYSSLNRFLGDAQSPMIEVNTNVKFLQAYVNEAAALAVNGAVAEVAFNPDLQGLPKSNVIAAGYCVLLNTQQKPNRLTVKPHFQEGITSAFNRNLNPYLQDYAQKTGWQIPANNFEISIEKGTITGISVKPATRKITDAVDREIGTMSYRPTFKINYDHKFETYPEIFFTLGTIANQCSNTPNPASCSLLKSLPPDWTVEQAGDTYNFKIQRANTQACYQLILPKSSQQST